MDDHAKTTYVFRLLLDCYKIMLSIIIHRVFTEKS